MSVPRKYDLDAILRWYECERKIPRADESTAAAVITRLDAAGELRSGRGVRPVPYPCSYGEHWHIGAPPSSDSRYHQRIVNAKQQYRRDVESGRIEPFAHLEVAG